MRKESEEEKEKKIRTTAPTRTNPILSPKKKQQALWPEGQHIVASGSSRYHGLQDDITSHHIPMPKRREFREAGHQHLPTYHSNVFEDMNLFDSIFFPPTKLYEGRLRYLLTVTSSCFLLLCLRFFDEISGFIVSLGSKRCKVSHLLI